MGLLGAYFVLVAFFQDRHEWVRRGFILYTLITILAWLVLWFWAIYGYWEWVRF